MSVNISVSSKTQKDCNNIINNLNKVGINARIIETKSCLDKNVENGCLITCDSEYSDKKKLKSLWNIINQNNDYGCCHLKIEGLFDGCIFNYIKPDCCPGNQDFIL
jgi:hypothetical protein